MLSIWTDTHSRLTAVLDQPSSSKAFSGAALVHLLLHRLHDLPNSTFSLVELEFSSQDLVSIFTKLHNGTTPEIEEYTEEDYHRDLQGGLMQAMRAGRTKGLATGTRWPGEKIQEFKGWEAKSLAEWIKQFA